MATVFIGFEQIQKLISVWRAQTQSELIIICYCLNKAAGMDAARKNLDVKEECPINEKETGKFAKCLLDQAEKW